ncbi:hypothetical protein SAMN05880582_10713 [Rhizobium sp. RU20A]|nr:hypothetical protein [Rhizobium sp. RU20A]SIR14646.1 hypothetical protein SAMN05880582_10713 [Rhizobium sp. RU20A]
MLTRIVVLASLLAAPVLGLAAQGANEVGMASRGPGLLLFVTLQRNAMT